MPEVILVSGLLSVLGLVFLIAGYKEYERGDEDFRYILAIGVSFLGIAAFLTVRFFSYLA